MKKAMLLSGAVAVVALTLISCGSTPESTTTTTRQTTVTAAPPPPTQTTTTTTHMSGGGYWLLKPAVGLCRWGLRYVFAFRKATRNRPAKGAYTGRIHPTANRWLQSW